VRPGSVEHALAVMEQLAQKNAALERARREPIAIVGMACRFPGGASTPATFWELLEEGRDAVRPLEGRWAWLGVPPPEAPGWAGLLGEEEISEFDAAFFEISDREARSLDPQQRLVLAVAWEALENAGVSPRALNGGAVSVFLGSTGSEYQRFGERAPEGERDAYFATGAMLSGIAGRLSYALGLQGPAVTLDTACSSSLVATHLACQSLRAQECSLALAGGVNLILSPEVMAGIALTRALSPDGRCRTFDARANGFVRGEGCGVLVLKRLSDAQRDGDRIWAVVRGSAVNQDGRSTGLTAPNVLAQQKLLRDALAAAKVDPAEVDFVETHGTGTALGADGSRCLLGALKTNVGHLEAAAGVAGLMKAAMALWHRTLPRNLGFESLNPLIRLEGTCLALADRQMPLPAPGRPLVAGVSAFGLSGTNAHVVLEEAPVESAGDSPRLGVGRALSHSGEAPVAAAIEAHAPPHAREAPPAAAIDAHASPYAREAPAGPVGEARTQPHARGAPAVPVGDARAPHAVPLLLSARTPEALARHAERIRAHLAAHPEVTLLDAAHTLAVARPHFEERAVLVGRERASVLEALGQVAGRHVRSAQDVAVLFPEESADWARPLHEANEVFRAAFDEVRQLPVPLASQVALFRLLQSWGLRPGAVLGVGAGEIAAAHVAGALSLEEASRGERAFQLDRAELLLAGQSPPGFAGGMRALEAGGFSLFLELGSGGELSRRGAECLGEVARARAFFCGLGPLDPRQRHGPAPDALVELLGELHARGAAVDWAAFFSRLGGRRVELPSTPFLGRRHWFPPAKAAAPPRAAPLERTVSAETGSALWTGKLDPGAHPWLTEQGIGGVAILPAAVSLELMAWAFTRETGATGFDLEEVSAERPLVPEPGVVREVQVVIGQQGSIDLYSRREGGGAWARHVRGRARAGERAAQSRAPEQLREEMERLPHAMEGAAFYEEWKGRGNSWGRIFRGVDYLRYGQDACVARIRAGAAARPGAFLVHSPLLDTCGQALAVFALSRPSGSFVGHRIGRCRLHAPPRGETFWSRVSLRGATDRTLTGDFAVYGEDGAMVLELEGLEIELAQPTARAESAAPAPVEDLEPALAAHFAELLGNAAIDPAESLLSLGLDSLMAYDAQHHIEQRWGVQVPVLQFLRGDSVSDLARFIHQTLEENR
jgi:acyl transferase domain-containing protein